MKEDKNSKKGGKVKRKPSLDNYLRPKKSSKPNRVDLDREKGSSQGERIKITPSEGLKEYEEDLRMIREQKRKMEKERIDHLKKKEMLHKLKPKKDKFTPITKISNKFKKY